MFAGAYAFSATPCHRAFGPADFRIPCHRWIRKGENHYVLLSGVRGRGARYPESSGPHRYPTVPHFFVALCPGIRIDPVSHAQPHARVSDLGVRESESFGLLHLIL